MSDGMLALFVFVLFCLFLFRKPRRQSLDQIAASFIEGFDMKLAEKDDRFIPFPLHFSASHFTQPARCDGWQETWPIGRKNSVLRQCCHSPSDRVLQRIKRRRQSASISASIQDWFAGISKPSCS
jgi:hypothetical protein